MENIYHLTDLEVLDFSPINEILKIQNANQDIFNFGRPLSDSFRIKIYAHEEIGLDTTGKKDRIMTTYEILFLKDSRISDSLLREIEKKVPNLRYVDSF